METNLNLSPIIDLATIILSLVAIVLTVLGFFASLRFYRDGVKLQSSASALIARIEEKVASLQTQVGGMFEKTLNAVIGHSSEQAAKEQHRLMLPTEDTHSSEESKTPAIGSSMPDELETTVMDYFSFKKLRFTDVSSDDAHEPTRVCNAGTWD